ncbi:MAG: hypothetical protein HN411_06485 [Waddliaceae bacterium]|jgi:hypothetical protein|nr:hypothetical protein [Waddliaceae bacterium]MBT3578870.1 hypothetical protein [Waddliaceae bacterium]MBT4445054.1 hypothetical protein [Waddliaceae bacterium]MBT6929062.1 hypothetical protein [Waddliaceae bacterium]MBT7264061.1 hypothetical protein [Waddliaceae bacterium]
MTEITSIYSDVPNDAPANYTYQLPMYYLYKQFYPGSDSTEFEQKLTNFNTYLDENKDSTFNPAGDLPEDLSVDFLDGEKQGWWIEYLKSLDAPVLPSIDIEKSTMQSYIQFEFLRVGNEAVVSQMNGLLGILDDITAASSDVSALVTFFNKRGNEVDDITVTFENDDDDTVITEQISPKLNVESNLDSIDYVEMEKIYNRLVSTAEDAISDSLKEALNAVIADLNPNDTFITEAAWKDLWGIGKEAASDDVDGSSIGLHLRQALIVTQNYNERAKAQLRQAMFTFEEFYKAAATLSNALTDMLENTARKIVK